MCIADTPEVTSGARVVAVFQFFSLSSVAESDISNAVTSVGDTSMQRAVGVESGYIEEDERAWRRRQYWAKQETQKMFIWQ
jgi:hypothetical protein